jgi:hypothetical protein
VRATCFQERVGCFQKLEEAIVALHGSEESPHRHQLVGERFDESCGRTGLPTHQVVIFEMLVHTRETIPHLSTRYMPLRISSSGSRNPRTCSRSSSSSAVVYPLHHICRL